MRRLAWVAALVLVAGCARRVETARPEPIAAQSASMAGLQFEAVMAAMPPLQLEVLAQPIPPLNTTNGVTLATSQTVSGAKTFSSAVTLSGAAPQLACSLATATCQFTSATNDATTTNAVPAWSLKIADINAADLGWAFTDSAGNHVFKVTEAGSVTTSSGMLVNGNFDTGASGSISSAGSVNATTSLSAGTSVNGLQFYGLAGNTIYVAGKAANGASAEGVALGNTTALTTVGAKALSIYSDSFGALEAFFDKDGSLWQGTATLRTCASGIEGMVSRDVAAGGTTTSKRTKLCLCTSDGAGSPTYAWQNLATGTLGNTTTCGTE